MSEYSESTLEFLQEKYRDSVKYLDNYEEQKRVEEDIYGHLHNERFGQLKQLAEAQEEKHDIDLSEIKNFVDTLQEENLVDKKSETKVKKELGQGIQHAIKQRLEDITENELILPIDKSVGIENLFQLQRNLYREQGKKIFPVSKQKCWNGRISTEIGDTKQKFEVLSVWQNKNNEYYFQHFGKKSPNKGFNKVETYSQSFFIYKFRADHTQYLVFSTEKMEPMRCKLYGTHYKLDDWKEIGESRALPVNQDIIFVHSVEPAIEELTDSEMKQMKGKDHEWFAENLLGKFRHPEWFEKLLIAVLSQGDDYGYPSPLFWFAPTGTGTSAALESMVTALDEREGVQTGSAGTVKALVPSFKDSPPDEGYLLKTQRIAAVDELLNLLSSTVDSGNGNIEDTFRAMQDLLEHKDRKFASGNGSIRAKPQSTMVAAANPSYGIENLMQAIDKLSTPFMARMILYSQTQSHIDFVDQRKAEFGGKPDTEMFPDRNDDFIALIDNFRDKVRLDVDGQRVKKIQDDIEDLVPASIIRAYRSRYNHHILNLVAGLAKYHTIVDGRDEFKVCDKDYEEAHRIMEIVVASWSSGVDMEEMNIASRPHYLEHEKRMVYEVVCNNPQGIKASSIDVNVDSISWCLKELSDLDLVHKKNDKYYPYWSEEIEQPEQKLGGLMK